MKKKYSFILLSSLLLISCGSKASISETTTEQSSSAPISESAKNTDEQEPITSEDNVSDESISSEDYEGWVTTGIHSIDLDDIPESEQSKYNEDFDFEGDGISYHGDLIQQGHGDYADTIQMKKQSSYFYSKVPVKGRLTLSILDKGDYTGIPTLYIGSEMNPETPVEWSSVSQSSNSFVYENDISGYFSIKDESSYAIYITSFQVDCN